MRTVLFAFLAALLCSALSCAPAPERARRGEAFDQTASASGAPGEPGCPQAVPLTEKHIGCRCGIEVLSNLHFRGADRLRKMFPDARYRCNEDRRLQVVDKSVFEHDPDAAPPD